MSRLSILKKVTTFSLLLSSLCLINSAQAQPGMKPAAPTRSTVVAGVAGEAIPVAHKKYIGNIEAIEEVDSIARVSGVLTVAPGFVEGMPVKKGQLLFTIDPIPYQAKVDAAQAAIQQLEAKIDYAQKNFERVNNLYSRQAGSKNDMESAESELLSLQAQLLSAKAQLTLAQEDLGYTQIKSEIDGRAGRRAYSTGNYVSQQSDPLVKVVQTDPIYVRFTMSERDYLSMFENFDDLKNNSKIELVLPNDETYPVNGEISFIDNTVKSTTDTIKVWATISNPNETLHPGGVVTVKLAKYATETKASVKPSAIMFDGEKNYVYILVDSITDEQLYEEIKSDKRFAKNIAIMEDGVKAIIDGPGAIANFLEQYRDNMIVAKSAEKLLGALESDKADEAAAMTISLCADLGQMKTFKDVPIEDGSAVVAEVKNGGANLWKSEFLANFKTQHYVYDDPKTNEKVNDFENNKVNDKYLMALRRDVVLGPADGKIETILSGISPNEVVMMDGVHKARPFDLVIPVSRDAQNNEARESEANAKAKAPAEKKSAKVETTPTKSNVKEEAKRVDSKKKVAMQRVNGDVAA